jgi:hypothetical protein
LRHQTRALGFEGLEKRELLAVQVILFASGELFILGDTANDAVTITENSTGTLWQISGPTVIGTPLQILKPVTQNVFVLLGGGNDSLSIRGINQATQNFIGELTVNMGLGADTVGLGSFVSPVAGDFNFVPAPGPNGSNANDFIGAVSVDLGGGVSATLATDATNSLVVENTDFGRLVGTPVNGQMTVNGSLGVDTIDIHGSINFGGWMDIQARAGADVIKIGVDATNTSFAQEVVQLGGSMTINAGDGADAVTLENVLAAGSIVVQGGAGDDSIRLGSGASVPVNQRVGSSTRGDMVVYGGDGNDNISINQATTVNSFLVNLGAGLAIGGNSLSVRNSSFSNDSAIIGDGSVDGLSLNAVNIVTNLFIQCGGGNDTIDIQGTLITAGALTINTDTGNDSVRVDNSNIRTLVLFTGDGDDNVTLTANLIDDFFADLGNGNDSINSESTYRKRGFVRGGAGANSGSGSNFSQGGNFQFEGF